MALTVNILSISVPLLLLLPLTSAFTWKQSNMVIIMADDMGWSDVEFRDEAMHTPNLNEMARTGVLFNSSYMLKSCSPSRSTFLTGVYAFKMGMQHVSLTATKNNSVPLDKRFFPQDLQDLGYSTHFVGKWHLGFCRREMTPTYRGFDTFYGMYNGAGEYFTHLSKLNGYDMQDNKGKENFSVDWSANGKYSTNLFTEKAVEIINNHDKSKPLFLFLSYQAVHGPLEVPYQYINGTKCSHVTNETRRWHCAMTAAMDEGIGEVREALDNKGLSENLITLFMSDNGGPVSLGSSNWPLRGSKITEWEGGTRVVTILHSTKRLLNAPYVWNGIMHATDWRPTLLTAAGIDVDTSAMDGNNNWRRIVTNSTSRTKEFVYNINEVKENRAIRWNQYKLLKFDRAKPDEWYWPPPGKEDKANGDTNTKEWMLFDLEKDPEERHNIIDQCMYNATVDKMKIKLKAYETELKTATAADRLMSKETFHNEYGGAWQPGWC